MDAVENSLSTDAATARVALNEAESAMTAARDRLAELLAARRPMAALARGDGETSLALSRSRDEIVDAELAVADAEARHEQARTVLAIAKRAHADQLAEQTLAAAQAIGTEIIVESEKFDSAISEAACALTRREALRQQISASGTMDPVVCDGLGRPSRIRRAFAVELAHWLTEHIPQIHRMKLAEQDRAAVRLLRKPRVSAAKQRKAG